MSCVRFVDWSVIEICRDVTIPIFWLCYEMGQSDRIPEQFTIYHNMLYTSSYLFNTIQLICNKILHSFCLSGIIGGRFKVCIASFLVNLTVGVASWTTFTSHWQLQYIPVWIEMCCSLRLYCTRHCPGSIHRFSLKGWCVRMFIC